MRVLGIDTHGVTGGAALIDGERLIGEILFRADASAAEKLAGTVAHLLDRPQGVWPATSQRQPHAKPEVEGIAVAIGPGSYTGLRIGVTTAKVLAHSWDIPLVGVGTFRALAYQLRCVAPVQATLLHARKDRLFGAVTRWEEGGEPEEIVPAGTFTIAEYVAALREVIDAGESLAMGGDGAIVFAEELRAAFGAALVSTPALWIHLHSASIAALGREDLLAGRADDPFTLAPDYLKKAEAELRWGSRQ